MPCLLASSASLGNVSETPERRPKDTRKDSRDLNFVEPMRGHAAAVLYGKPNNGTINNVAPWTKAALGYSLSPAQFLADPDA